MAKIQPFYSIQAGWLRYKNKAGMYSAFAVVSIIISGALGGIATAVGSVFDGQVFLQTTVTALIIGIVGAFLNMGYAHFAKNDIEGADVEFRDFFAGFILNRSKLIAVTIIAVLAAQGASLLLPTELMAFNITQEQSQNMEELMMAFEDQLELAKAHSSSLYLFVLIQGVLGLLLFFTAFRSSLEGEDPLVSIQWSIRHALSNVIPIITTMFLLVVLAIVVTVFTLGLGLLVVLPLIALVTYDMYTQLIQAAENIEKITPE